MKKVTLGFMLMMTLWLVVGCVPLTSVKSISLNWVPQDTYERIEDNADGGVAFAGKTITVTLNQGSEIKELSESDIEVEGNGVYVDSGNRYLQLEYVGKFDVDITYEGFTISFEYYVNDTDLVQLLNNQEIDRENFNTIITDNAEELGIGIVLGNLIGPEKDYADLAALFAGLNDWQYSVFYTRNELGESKFEDAYEAQQIIVASLIHGVLAGNASEKYLGETLFPSWEDETFDVIDWNIMGLNLLDLWDQGKMEYMAFPSLHEHPDVSPMPLTVLADMYEALFYGGEEYIILIILTGTIYSHPHIDHVVAPIDFSSLDCLKTKTTWPGLLKLPDVDENVAEFLYDTFDGDLPSEYQTMGFALIEHLIDDPDYESYFDKTASCEIG